MRNYVVVVMRGDIVSEVIGPLQRLNAERIARAIGSEIYSAYAMPLTEA